MHYSQVKLPKEKKDLINCYLYLTIRLRALWIEYVQYAESSLDSQQASFYLMLFDEMDFYEALRLRIQENLPKKLIPKLRSLDDYSRW